MTGAELRLGFAGTPDIAAQILSSLLQQALVPECVLTRPDRPAGRGRSTQPGPVKRLANEQHLPVLQPANNRELHSLSELKQLDLLIVVAYGLILPGEVLAMPRLGCINVHMSLLPRWRGAAPIQRAIEAGDSVSGVSVMQMDAGLDTGPLLARQSCPLDADETGGTLHDKLAKLGARALINVLHQMPGGKLQAQAQDEKEATYAHKISKDETQIDWQQPAMAIERRIRAFNPAPIMRTELMQQPFRIWQAAVIPGSKHMPPGSIINADDAGIDIATGDGVLRVLQFQPAGKRVMHVGEFLNGHPGFFRKASA